MANFNMKRSPLIVCLISLVFFSIVPKALADANQQVGAANQLSASNNGSATSGSVSSSGISNINVQNNTLSNFTINGIQCATPAITGSLTSSQDSGLIFSGAFVIPLGGSTAKSCRESMQTEVKRQKLANAVSVIEKCTDWIKIGIDVNKLPEEVRAICQQVVIAPSTNNNDEDGNPVIPKNPFIIDSNFKVTPLEVKRTKVQEPSSKKK